VLANAWSAEQFLAVWQSGETCLAAVGQRTHQCDGRGHL